ncbi:hypothetical protein [Nocardioides daphniae]|uniref:hypothetical protein n=1 Tax=Nocardioides daphniae TaxID=402297 RepID=UPI001668B8BA|nr:hypothetical protein [Nocardioides daphniae]
MAALALAAALALTGCSEDEPTDSPAPEKISITITDDEVSPLGERVEVPAGEPFTVEITADRAGEMHVHSNPEQEWAFEEGTTTIEATLDQPGVAEVELHDPDVVVLQLEVR